MSEDLSKNLEKLLKTMDLPWNRKKDFTPKKLKWLKKNLDKFNADHEHRDAAMTLVNVLIKNG